LVRRLLENPTLDGAGVEVESGVGSAHDA